MMDLLWSRGPTTSRTFDRLLECVLMLFEGWSRFIVYNWVDDNLDKSNLTLPSSI